MAIELAPTLTFVLATTFSPGPNNLLSGSVGLLAGYRRALTVTLGIATGYVLVMLLCGAAARGLGELFSGVEPALRYAGAAYILWLAWSTWRLRKTFAAGIGGDPPPSRGFRAGLVLQFANLKVVVYGLVLFSTFLADLAGRPGPLALGAVVLAALSLASTTTWALAGAALRRRLRTDGSRAIAAGVLALALVYSAVSLALP